MTDNSFPAAPEPAKDGYARCRVEGTIAIPADSFFDWYMYEPLENFMHGAMIVPGIARTEPLAGPSWGEPGSARKIIFRDGSSALERILSTDLPRSYSYQPWAYTNPVRLMSDYAVSTMSALPEGDGTRIVWDYGFHARNSVFMPMLQLFVSVNWTRNLQNGLTVFKRHLETHGTQKRIVEAA